MLLMTDGFLIFILLILDAISIGSDNTGLTTIIAAISECGNIAAF